MRYIAFLLSIVGLSFASEVLDFSDNFNDVIGDHEIILVEFFAPWCGHCKKLAPEYDLAADMLQNADPPVALAKVDCTSDGGKDVCSKHGVSGYPTLKIFRNGEFAEEYQGPREAEGIVKTMKSKAGPSFRTVTTIEEAEKFLAIPEYGIFGFFKDGESDLANTFKKVADALNADNNFALTTDKKVMEKYGYSDDVVIFQPTIYQSKFEDAQQKYADDTTVYKMKNWISGVTLGLCGFRTPNNAENFKKPLVTIYFDVNFKLNVKGANYWRNRAMKLATKLKEAGKTIYFSVSNADIFSHELSEFGLKASDQPVVAIRDAKDQKFPMSGKLSYDTLESFVTDFLDGKLKPYMKSEPIPEPNDDPVKVVVAENFQEIVNDEDKDVLIEFYAPWCGHCKSLAPKYDELGEKLKDEPGITIAKMDATANDVPKEYEVRGFPTIYFAPRGKKGSPQTYQGGREVDDFLKYLAKEAKDELVGYNRSGKSKSGKKKKKTEL